MKTQCLQTNEMQHYWKGKCVRSKRWSRERVALIKSLIHLSRGCQIELNLPADKCTKENPTRVAEKPIKVILLRVNQSNFNHNFVSCLCSSMVLTAACCSR